MGNLAAGPQDTALFYQLLFNGKLIGSEALASMQVGVPLVLPSTTLVLS